MSEVKVRQLTAEEADVSSPVVLGEAGVTVLPLRRTEDGRGVYAQDQVSLVKEMRAKGLDIAFLDAPEGRVFEAKYGFLTDIAGPYLFNVAAGGGWAGLALLVRKLRGKGDARVVRIVITETPSGKSWVVEGPADLAAEEIERLEVEASPRDDE